MKVKLPRMSKASFSTQVLTRELWKDFCREFPEYRDMDWDTFRQRWAEITETIRTEAVMNPLGIKLNSYLGEIKTQFLPYKFKATDRQSLAEGEPVSHLNILTRGKVATIKWERRWAVKFNQILQFYAFEPNSAMNKISKSYIPENAEKVRVSRNTLGGKHGWR